MNQTHAYVDVGHGHMPHSSVSSAASGPPLYSNYPQHSPMHNGVQSYASSPVTYTGYGNYANGMGSIPSGASSAGPMTSQMVQQSPLSLPTLATSSQTSPAPQNGAPRAMDTTGQIPPHGMKPRVTATLWEDEGSLCFQVEAGGVCVARREDNHMINGTKLLNVAGMTRGRRDGILKSEKTRHVVKIGPMHLKGVWIPFDRALDFANKEKITEQLYPLFVHNIGALLYQSPSGSRHSISTTGVTNPERRRQDSQSEYMRTPQSTQPPTLQHHHSLANPVGIHNQPAAHSLAPNTTAGRPGLDRAHTFPTPPTSASSMMGMGNNGAAYEWNGANVPTTQPLSIDTSLTNARSVPATPASTPPANPMHNMSGYQTSGPYDNTRPMYGHSAQQSYGSQYGMNRFSGVHPSPGVKNEMGPPPRTGHDGDDKRDLYTSHSHDHPPSSDAGEAEHDADYTHSAGPYGQGRATYGYNTQSTPTNMNHDQSHVSPEMTDSPQKGSGRATPRTATGYSSYSTPQRAQHLPSSNLYNVMNDNRNGSGTEMYATNYSSQQYPTSNGVPSSNKRGFALDDDEQTNNVKRQKSTHERKPPAMMAQQQKR